MSAKVAYSLRTKRQTTGHAGLNLWQSILASQSQISRTAFQVPMAGTSWCLWHRHQKSNRRQYSFMLLSIWGFYLLEFLFNPSIDVYFNILKPTISVRVTFPLLSVIPANKIKKKLCSETIFQQGSFCQCWPVISLKHRLPIWKIHKETIQGTQP